jgi:hypothetical protein
MLNRDITVENMPERARAGIRERSASVVTLARGTRFFRGGCKDLPDQGIIASWWLREEDLHRIALQANPGKFMGSLGFTLRVAAAIQQVWSAVDVLIQAEVLEDIRAFQGPGNRQEELLSNGIRVTWRGWGLGLLHIHIPNLDRERSTMQTLVFDGKPALGVLAVTDLPSEQVFREAYGDKLPWTGPRRP